MIALPDPYPDLRSVAKTMYATQIFPADTYDRIGGKWMVESMPAHMSGAMQEHVRTLPGFMQMAACITTSAAQFNLPVANPDLRKRVHESNVLGLKVAEHIETAANVFYALSQEENPSTASVLSVEKLLSNPPRPGAFLYAAQFLRIKAHMMGGFLETAEKLSGDAFPELLASYRDLPGMPPPEQELGRDELKRLVSEKFTRQSQEMSYAADCLERAQKTCDEQLGPLFSRDRER